jgi:hypothetical protein
MDATDIDPIPPVIADLCDALERFWDWAMTDDDDDGDDDDRHAAVETLIECAHEIERELHNPRPLASIVSLNDFRRTRR